MVLYHLLNIYSNIIKIYTDIQSVLLCVFLFFLKHFDSERSDGANDFILGFMMMFISFFYYSAITFGVEILNPKFHSYLDIDQKSLQLGHRHVKISFACGAQVKYLNVDAK